MPTRLLTVCLGLPRRPCTNLVPSGRCSSCATARERERRPSSRVRYGPDHERRRAELVAAEPWCHNPGCRATDVGSAANPLTLQHIEPVIAGGRDGPATVWCKRCNSAQGARRLEESPDARPATEGSRAPGSP